MNRRAHSHAPRRGFSLVEVVLSIGVISIAFVGVFGLLSAGLDVFRTSMNTSVGTQIAERLLNEAQQTEFSILVGAGNPRELPVRYFDDHGNEMKASEANASIFQARTVVQGHPDFPDQAGQNTIPMADLAAVVVQVAINPGQRPLTKDGTTLLWKTADTIVIQNYPVLVAHYD